jgi:hypothetical protein
VVAFVTFVAESSFLCFVAGPAPGIGLVPATSGL